MKNMSNSLNTFYRYWGKVCPSENTEVSYHLLPYHCLDVAAVGRVLLDDQSALLQQFANLTGIDRESFLNWSTFLLAIHDIGKFADTFQNKRPDLLQQLQNRNTQLPSNEHHSSLGYRFCLDCVTPIFIETGMHRYDLQDLLKPWFSAVTGHHGRPPKLDPFPPPIQKQFPDYVHKDALGFVQEIILILLLDGLPFSVDACERYYQIFPRISWLMAGLAVVADWIGSNRYWFPYKDKLMPLSDYWYDIALPQAKTAVAECGLTTQNPAPFSGMRMLFPAISSTTSLQQLTEEIEITEGPQLFIIEEVTGGGKTEAGLTLAHRLMAKGEASGLFMALPTMATANAMHERIKQMYQKLFLKDSSPSFILAHSDSWMALDLERKNLVDKGYGNEYENNSASQDCTTWLSDSRKKALLAHVGVGTIDQALLAILPVRHQSLRLLGIVRKVLIVDEVHACDSYVHRLLCTLLQFHSAQGGSAILLSATLPQAMRAEILNSFAKGAGIKAVNTTSNAYPLVTHLSITDVREVSVSARKSVSRRVKVQPLYCVDEVKKVLQDVLNTGGCACWVRNTVYDAMQSYHEWIYRDRVMLFHARFTLGDRLKIEEEVKHSFGPTSTTKDRQGKLLIATQVVEQSLDMDFDFMVSDLAPIDLLIQRAGRLHRHTRGQRKPPVLGVYMPQLEEEAEKDWFKGVFPKAAKVYDHHGQLWLTAKWLNEHQGFSVPEEAREMIESVYGESSQVLIPKGLQTLESLADGEDKANAALGRLNSLNPDDGYQSTMTHWQDDISAPTRLGEPTVTVRLARWDGTYLVPWNAENTGHDWELSQLTIRQSQIAKEYPNNLMEPIVVAKQTMPDEGRYCVVILMQQSEGKWTGHALNKQDKIVIVTYDNYIGLKVKKGERE